MMAGRDLRASVCFCLLSFCLFPAPASGICDPANIYGNSCFEVVTEYKTASEARAVCGVRAQRHGYNSRRAGLAAPRDRDTNAALNALLLRARAALADPYNMTGMFVGGRETPGTPIWKWISDCQDCGGISGKRVISAQGCFREKAGVPDLPYQVYPATVTPPTCVQACRQQGYLWAGVSASTPPRQDKCLCGYTHGDVGKGVEETAPADCNMPCQADVTQKCGGNGHLQVFKVDGAFALWASNQPNYYDEKQFCGVLGLSAFHNYKLLDETCHSYTGFRSLCHIPMPRCISAYNYQRVAYGAGQERCVFVNTDDSTFTWYKAREKCVQLGGDLLAVDSLLFHNALRDALKDTFPNANYWVGLNSRPWTWPDGERLIFTDWETEQPFYSKTSNCMAVKYAYHMPVPRYWWSDKDCAAKAYFICEYVISNPTTTTTTTTPAPTTTTTEPTTTTVVTNQPTPTTTTTTPTPTTTTTAAALSNNGVATQSQGSATPIPVTITAIPSGNNNNNNGAATPTTADKNGNSIDTSNSIKVPVDPASGASSGDADRLTTFQIVLIVILVLLFIIIIIVLVVCILYKKKDSRARVSPNLYDARNEAKLPYSGSLGDEVYLPPSETGSTSELIADPKIFGDSYALEFQQTQAYGPNPNRISIGNN